MVRAYLYLFRKAYDIKEEKIYAWLHLHDYHDRREMLEYWSRITRIPQDRIKVYNKKNSGIRKKTGYKGCLSVRYGDHRIFDEVLLIAGRFANLNQ